MGILREHIVEGPGIDHCTLYLKSIVKYEQDLAGSWRGRTQGQGKEFPAEGPTCTNILQPNIGELLGFGTRQA